MFQFIEVNPSEVELGCIDAKGEGKYVYEHLKYCCTKNQTIPAFEVREVNGRLISANRHIYLAIAKELKREVTRAVVMDNRAEDLRARGIKGLVRVISNDILKREAESEWNTGWHIFFFKRQPSCDDAQIILARFKQFLEESLTGILPSGSSLVIESEFDLARACFAIEFPTPAFHDWSQSFRTFCLTVDKEVLPIATYQGVRWDAMSPPCTGGERA